VLRIQDDARASQVAELEEQRVRLERELDAEAGRTPRLGGQRGVSCGASMKRPRW